MQGLLCKKGLLIAPVTADQAHLFLFLRQLQRFFCAHPFKSGALSSFLQFYVHICHLLMKKITTVSCRCVQFDRIER